MYYDSEDDYDSGDDLHADIIVNDKSDIDTFEDSFKKIKAAGTVEPRIKFMKFFEPELNLKFVEIIAEHNITLDLTIAQWNGRSSREYSIYRFVMYQCDCEQLADFMNKHIVICMAAAFDCCPPGSHRRRQFLEYLYTNTKSPAEEVESALTLQEIKKNVSLGMAESVYPPFDLIIYSIIKRDIELQLPTDDDELINLVRTVAKAKRLNMSRSLASCMQLT